MAPCGAVFIGFQPPHSRAVGGVVSSGSCGIAMGESDLANLAGGMYQLLQLMMDLAAIELL